MREKHPTLMGASAFLLRPLRKKKGDQCMRGREAKEKEGGKRALRNSRAFNLEFGLLRIAIGVYLLLDLSHSHVLMVKKSSS